VARRKERIFSHVTLRTPAGRAGRAGTAGRIVSFAIPPILPVPPILPMKPLIIAIDGPSGAGKGTVARAIAGALGYRHLYSGAMYRAVGWKALHDLVPLDDEDAIARLADRADIAVSDSL